MHDLAITIRNRLETLANEYDERLQKITDYPKLPAQAKFDAKHILNLVATCLENDDQAAFTHFIDTHLRKQVKQSAEAESLLQALDALGETLWPLVTDAERHPAEAHTQYAAREHPIDSAKWIWQTLSQARAIVYAKITAERKRAEAASKELRRTLAAITESEQILANIINFLPDPTFVIDQGGQVIAWNQAIEEMTGVKAELMLGRGNYEYALPFYGERRPTLADMVLKPQEEFEEKYASLKRQGETLFGETYVPHLGKGLYLMAAASALFDPIGNVIGAIEIIRDITERKQAEEELARLSRAVEATHDVVMITDVKGSIQFVNQAFEQITGYSRDEALGRNPNILKSGKQSDQLYAEMWQTISSGQVWQGEVTNRRKDGTLYEARLTISPVRNQAGQVEQYVAIQRDVTQRKRAEEALEAQQAFLHQVIDINPNMIFVRDREGRFVLANQAVAEGYNTMVENLIGKTDADFNPDPQAVEDLHRDDLQVMDSLQEKFIPELRIIDEAGNERWVQTIKRPLVDEDGVARQVLGVSSDITQRKQLEQTIRKSLERRGREVQTSTEVAQEIAAAPALDELFRRVVTLIKERFGYYHAQIFRYEPALDAVVLVTSYGEAGQRMLARGHRLAMGRGVVGTAAATGKPILATDVAKDKDWRPNPDLPETKGELAVPIILRQAQDGVLPHPLQGQDGQQVLGILDVQSKHTGALTQDDQLLLEGLCGQIAIAIQNTSLRQEMEERLRELNTMYRAMSREGWQDFRQTTQLPEGYLFDRLDVRSLDAASGEAETPSLTDVAEAAVAPLSVRGGEIVGALGIYDDPQQPLSPDDLALLESVSEQVALALESTRLFEQTQLALNESQVLYQASAELSAAQTYDDILTALRQHTILGQADRNVSINLFDRPWIGDDMPELSIPIARWSAPGEAALAPALSSQYPLRALPSTRIILQPNAPTVIRDVKSDPSLDDNFRALYTQRFQAQSTIFAPLVVGGQWIGYVNGIYGELTNFPEAEVRSLMGLISQAAVAVQSIRQLEETQRRAHHEQTLREITTAISASQEFLTESLPDIVWYLRELVPVDRLTLTTYAPGELECTVLAASDEIEASQLARRGSRLPLKTTAEGWVITYGRPRLDADLRESRPFPEDAHLMAEGLASRLILPLKIAGQTIGTLSLDSARPGAFAEEHITLLEPLADQIALTTERTRLIEETRAALAEAEATHRRYLREQWDTYLADAVEQAIGYLDGPMGLRPVSQVDVASGEAEAPSLTEEPDGFDGLTTGVQNRISVPIKVRGEPIGMLEFYDEDTRRTWSDEERVLVETLADQAGLALENTRLFEDTQSRAQREHLISEITGKIRATTDMETILRTTAEELARALNLSGVHIHLRTAEEEDE